jgi:hypothetical protein
LTAIGVAAISCSDTIVILQNSTTACFNVTRASDATSIASYNPIVYTNGNPTGTAYLSKDISCVSNICFSLNYAGKTINAVDSNTGNSSIFPFFPFINLLLLIFNINI